MKTPLTPEQYIRQLQESIVVKERVMARQDDKINKLEEKVAKLQEQMTALRTIEGECYEVKALGGRDE